jgi:hypothetical protein
MGGEQPTWPTEQDRARLARFVDLLKAATKETGIAVGICPECDETKLYDLLPGVKITYQLVFTDHLFVDPPDTPCAVAPPSLIVAPEVRKVRRR